MNKSRCPILFAAAFLGLLGIFSFGAAAPGRSERIIALPELESPRQIVVEKGRVFYVDRRNIVVCNLLDGRFLKKIGKPGQGPGEYDRGPSRLSVLGDRLVIQGLNGSEIFSLDGVHESGFKNPQLIAFYSYLPVGRHFVGFPMLRGEDGSLSGPFGRVYDSDLKLEREFYGDLPAFPPPPPPPGSAGPKESSDPLLIRDYGDYAVHEDRIYVADSSEGFLIALKPDFETPFFNRFKYNIEGDDLIWFTYNDDKETYQQHIR